MTSWMPQEIIQFSKRRQRTKLRFLISLTNIYICIKAMVTYFMNIEKNSSDAFNTLTIRFNDLFKKLIEMADPIDDPLPKDLQKVVERENPVMKTPAADWENQDYEQYSFKITQAQNLIVDQDVVRVICNILTFHSVDSESQHEAILTGISVLLGGNVKGQGKFLEYFEQDVKNLFITSIKNLIDSNLVIVKKAMDKLNKSLQDNKFKKYQQNTKMQNHESENDEKMIQEPTFRPSKSELDQSIIQIEQESQFQEELYEFESQAIIDIKRLFRFLQLFCEGHNQDMQNYLREQKQNGILNGKSINMISNACQIFGGSIKYLNFISIEFIQQIADFLIESIQGPSQKNQETLVNAKLVYFCRDVISMFAKDIEYTIRGFISEEQKQKANSFVSKCTKLLVSLVEAYSNKSIFFFSNKQIEIYKMLSQTLDLENIRKRLVVSYKELIVLLKLPQDCSLNEVNSKMCQQYLNLPLFLDDSFQMFILICTLSDALKAHKNINKAHKLLNAEYNTKIEINCLQFFKMNTGSIEINFNDQLVRVFYQIQPLCRNLSKSSRTRLMTNVKRDNPTEKIQGLINEVPIFFIEMKHLSYLKKIRFQFTSTKLSIIQDCCTFLAFSINGLMLYSLKREVNHNYTQITIDPFLNLISNILEFIQILFSFLMVLFWLVIYAPIVIKSKWQKFNRGIKTIITKFKENQIKSLKEMDEKIIQCSEQPSLMSPTIVKYLMDQRGPYINEFKAGYGSNFASLYYNIKSFCFLFSDMYFVYILLYLTTSIMGSMYGQIFYCLPLLDIVRRFEMLQNVIKSVTGNYKQLLLTLFLMLLILQIYSLFIYYFFSNNFYLDENMCLSVLQCLLSSLKFGLPAGGGIAESLKDQSYEPQNQYAYWIRWVFDISFYVVIIVMLLNIIFGIIIDTFASLRDEKNNMLEDMRTRCYICGLDRYQFEKYADGFKKHIERDHQLWNYLYYIIYIQSKDQTELNGIESLVLEKIGKYDNSWVPVMKAVSLMDKLSTQGSIHSKLEPRFGELWGSVKILESRQQNDK